MQFAIALPVINIHIATRYKCVVNDPAIRAVAEKNANIIAVLRWPRRSPIAPVSGPEK